MDIIIFIILVLAFLFKIILQQKLASFEAFH